MVSLDSWVSLQPQRPAASLLLSRRECLLAFPAAVNLKDIKASRPTERKVQANSSAALVQMYDMFNLMPYSLQVVSTMAKLSQEELGKYSLEVVPQLSSRAPPAQLHTHSAQSFHPPSLAESNTSDAYACCPTMLDSSTQLCC